MCTLIKGVVLKSMINDPESGRQHNDACDDDSYTTE